MVGFQKKWLALGILPVAVLIATRQPGSSTEAAANPSQDKAIVEKSAADGAADSYLTDNNPSMRSMSEPDSLPTARSANGDPQRAKQEKQTLESHIAELESQIAVANQTIAELRSQAQLASERHSPDIAPSQETATLRAQLQQAISEKEQLSLQLQNRGTDSTPVEALRTENTELRALAKKMRDREDIILDKLTKARNDLITAQGELDGSRNKTTNYAIIERERNALKQDLETAKERLAKLEADLEQANNVSVNNGYLRTEMEKFRRDNAVLNKQAEELAAIKPEYERAVSKLKELSAESVDVKANLGQTQNQLKTVTEERNSLKKSLESQTKELKAKGENAASLESQLTQAQQRVKTLEEQLTASEVKSARFTEMEQALIKARNEVVLRETELKLLQGQRGAQERVAAGAAPTAAANRGSSPTYPPLSTPLTRATTARAPASDVLIGEVTEDKVNLRAGPGQEHAPVMQVQKGSRLTIEAKEGDWYRVITPTDTRAYVRTDVIRTTTGNTPMPTGSAAQISNPSAALSLGLASPIPAPKRIDDDTVYDSFGNGRIPSSLTGTNGRPTTSTAGTGVSANQLPGVPAAADPRSATPPSVRPPASGTATGGPIKFEDEAQAAFESLKNQIQNNEKH